MTVPSAETETQTGNVFQSSVLQFCCALRDTLLHATIKVTYIVFLPHSDTHFKLQQILYIDHVHITKCIGLLPCD